MTIYIYSDLYLPTHPFLDFPLYHELKKRGIDVKYVLQDGDIRLTLPETTNNFKALDLLTPKSTTDIVNLIGPKDLLVMPFRYKYTGGKAADKARATKKRILMLDPAAVDLMFRQVQAQFITAKSEWMRSQVIKKIGSKYAKIFPTGTIHFDAAWDRSKWISKKELMILHGLDPTKKLAVLCKASQGESGHQNGIDEEYKQIAQALSKNPEYELLFKCHPIDHLSEFPLVPGVIHKNEHYENKPSWLTIFPQGIKMLKPELGYNTFGVCDVILNVRSSIGMEAPLFPTPVININSHKYTTNWPLVKDREIMVNIEMKDLVATLKNIPTLNHKKCKEYVKKYCDPMADGKAYIRTADVIEKIIS